MSASRALQATAAAHAFVAIGHTLKSQDFMNDPQFRRLPRLVGAYARAGWFQGTSLFLIAAILNYRWSRNPLLLTDSLDKAIAAVTVATYWATAVWYMSQEDKTTSGLLTVVGGLQTWSAFFAQR